MILTECAAFVSALFAGVLAGTLATFFYRLGSASRAARWIFDFLTPLSMGALYYCALFFAADGVFRFYTLAAFFLGALAQRAIHKRISPFLRAFARRIVLPIKSLEDAFESKVERVLAPLREKRNARREKRRKRREEARGKRAEGKARRELAAASRIRDERRRKGGAKGKRARQRRDGRGRPLPQSD